MTYARAHLIDQENPGYYHLITRCVRRAYLRGIDPTTGTDVEHRKTWVEHRIEQLNNLFSVEVYGYAVFSDQYHVLVRSDPKAPHHWPDEEVTRRWLEAQPRRTPVDYTTPSALSVCESSRKEHDVAQEKIPAYRSRLGNVSWFMRFINEPIARRANTEDGCRGRFWEGRFKSRALADMMAVRRCMSEFKLNPFPLANIENSRAKTRTDQRQEPVRENRPGHIRW